MLVVFFAPAAKLMAHVAHAHAIGGSLRTNHAVLGMIYSDILLNQRHAKLQFCSCALIEGWLGDVTL